MIHADHDKDGALAFYHKALAIDETDLAANPYDAQAQAKEKERIPRLSLVVRLHWMAQPKPAQTR